MKQENIMEQLIKEAEYAQRSESRDLLLETWGKAKMAGQLNAISFEGFMKINHMTIYYINTHAGTVFETTRTDVWIPCSERLPEEPEGAVVVMEELEEYLVAVYGADKPTTLKYAGNGEWWDDVTEGFYPVQAWQPMPDQYVGSLT